MGSERQNMSDQEISMKARESELYVSSLPDGPSRPVKPFPAYLKETAAEPFSAGTKAVLWTVGLIVALLFLSALWRVSRGHLARPPARTSAPGSKTAMF
jgi:hypothetical protein